MNLIIVFSYYTMSRLKHQGSGKSVSSQKYNVLLLFLEKYAIVSF